MGVVSLVDFSELFKTTPTYGQKPVFSRLIPFHDVSLTKCYRVLQVA